MDDYITLVSLIMGVSSFTGGLVLWYRGAVEKRFASERDFQHLKRNYEQLASMINQVDNDLDARYESMMTQLLEIKGLLYGAIGDRSTGGRS